MKRKLSILLLSALIVGIFAGSVFAATFEPDSDFDLSFDQTTTTTINLSLDIPARIAVRFKNGDAYIAAGSDGIAYKTGPTTKVPGLKWNKSTGAFEGRPESTGEFNITGAIASKDSSTEGKPQNFTVNVKVTGISTDIIVSTDTTAKLTGSNASTNAYWLGIDKGNPYIPMWAGETFPVKGAAGSENDDNPFSFRITGASKDLKVVGTLSPALKGITFEQDKFQAANKYSGDLKARLKGTIDKAATDKVYKLKIEASNAVKGSKITQYYSFDVRALPQITQYTIKDVNWSKDFKFQPKANLKDVSWDIISESEGTETTGTISSADLKKLGISMDATTGLMTGVWKSQDVEDFVGFPDLKTKVVYKTIKLAAVRNIRGQSNNQWSIVSSRSHTVDVKIPFVLPVPVISADHGKGVDLSVDEEVPESKFALKATGPGYIQWKAEGLPPGVSINYPDVSNDRQARAESWITLTGTPTAVQKQTAVKFTAMNAAGSSKVVTVKIGVVKQDAEGFTFTDDTYTKKDKKIGFSGVFAVNDDITKAPREFDEYSIFNTSADLLTTDAGKRVFEVTAGPVKWTAKNLPKGITLKSTGPTTAELTGKFTKAQIASRDNATYTIHAALTSDKNVSADISGDIYVYAKPEIKTSKISKLETSPDKALNMQFDAKDNEAVLAWDIVIGGQESGDKYVANEDLSDANNYFLAVSSDRGIYGSLDVVPTGGKFTVDVTASNPAGSTKKTFTVEVSGKKPAFKSVEGDQYTKFNSSVDKTVGISFDAGTLPITMKAYIDASTAKKFFGKSKAIDLTEDYSETGNNPTGFVFEPNDESESNLSKVVGNLKYLGEAKKKYSQLPITIEAYNIATGDKKPVKLASGKYKVDVAGQDLSFDIISRDGKTAVKYSDDIIAIAGQPLGYRDDEFELVGDEGYIVGIRGEAPLNITVTGAANGIKTLVRDPEVFDSNYYKEVYIYGTPTKGSATKTKIKITAKNPSDSKEKKDLTILIKAQLPPTITTDKAGLTQEVEKGKALAMKLKVKGDKPYWFEVSEEADGDFTTEKAPDYLKNYGITFLSPDSAPAVLSADAAATAGSPPTLDDDGTVYKPITVYVRAANGGGKSPAVAVNLGIKGKQPKFSTKKIEIVRGQSTTPEILTDLTPMNDGKSVDVKYTLTAAEQKKLDTTGLTIQDEGTQSNGRVTLNNANNADELLATAAKGVDVKFTATNYGTSNTGSINIVVKDDSPDVKNGSGWGETTLKLAADAVKVEESISLELSEKSQPTGATKMKWEVAKKPSSRAVAATLKADKSGGSATLTFSVPAKYASDANDLVFNVKVTNQTTGKADSMDYTVSVTKYDATAGDLPEDIDELEAEAIEGEDEAEAEAEAELVRGEGDVILGETRTVAGLTGAERTAIEEVGYVIAAVLPEVTVTEDGLYDLDAVELVEEAPEGAELVWFAFPRDAAASDDDEIAEFYDEAGAEIEVVPEGRQVVPAAWFNAEVTYAPVIAVKVEKADDAKETLDEAEEGDVVTLEALESAE